MGLNSGRRLQHDESVLRRGADVLERITVSEIGGTVASAASGAMFRQLGAAVTKYDVEDAVQGAEHQSSMRDECLAVLDRGKKRGALPIPWPREALESISRSDVVVADIAQLEPEAREAYVEYVSQVNSSVWVTLSPFGLMGSRKNYLGTELTTLASGGIPYYMRNSHGRPMKPAGYTASIAAGHFAVLAALHGQLRRRQVPDPVHMDVSRQDCVLVTGVFLECAHKLFDCPGEGGTSRYVAPRGLVRAADGLLNIIVLEDHQWLGCLRAMGNPEWASRVRTAADRVAHAGLVQQQIEEWASTKKAADCARLLQAEGVPATPVNSCADLLDDSDLAQRHFFASDENGARVPTAPVVESVVEHPASSSGTGTNTTRRARILDLTHVLAGPLATSWLGTMGVDVVKVEDPDRTDVYRRRGPYPAGVHDIEASAYFAASNYSKRSFAARPEQPDGRETLRALIDSSDLVLENLSAGRARRLGLTPEHFQDLDGPRLLSSSGFGRTTTIADYRAYGHNIHAFGGAIDLSRDRFGAPTDLGTSWADPLTAIWLAVLTAAQLLRPRAERTNIDVSMVEVVAYQFPEFFARTSLDGKPHVADESRLDEGAPHGFYTCAGDDNWIAIAVRDDSEWQRLLKALRMPDALAGERFHSADSRAAAQDELDQAMDEVLSRHDVHELFKILQAARVPASPVWGASDLVADQHLYDRGLFQTVDHPVWGRRSLAGLPWRSADRGAFPITATALLGQDTTQDPVAVWTRKVADE